MSDLGDPDTVSARPVDPRDTVWEDDHPVFRVTFFDLAPGADPPPRTGVNTDEWEVRDVDVHGALAWARHHAGPYRTYSLHLRLAPDGLNVRSPGLVWLAGSDPNTGEWESLLRSDATSPPPS